jgi:ribonuclease Z
VRRLVLTHFSQRYLDLFPFKQEAESSFRGDVVVAMKDLMIVPVPGRIEQE